MFRILMYFYWTCLRHYEQGVLKTLWTRGFWVENLKFIDNNKYDHSADAGTQLCGPAAPEQSPRPTMVVKDRGIRHFYVG